MKPVAAPVTVFQGATRVSGVGVESGALFGTHLGAALDGAPDAESPAVVGEPALSGPRHALADSVNHFWATALPQMGSAPAVEALTALESVADVEVPTAMEPAPGVEALAAVRIEPPVLTLPAVPGETDNGDALTDGGVEPAPEQGIEAALPMDRPVVPVPVVPVFAHVIASRPAAMHPAPRPPAGAGGERAATADLGADMPGSGEALGAVKTAAASGPVVPVPVPSMSSFDTSFGAAAGVAATAGPVLPASSRTAPTTQVQGAPTVDAPALPAVIPALPSAMPAPVLVPVLVPAAVPAAVPASVPVQAPPLAEQLARPLFTLAAAPLGEHVMTIDVVPDSLGPVTVRAHLGAEGVRIELMPASDAGRESLRSILTELKRDLAAGGMASTLSLGSGHAAPEQGGHRSPQGSAVPWGAPEPSTEQNKNIPRTSARANPVAANDSLDITV